MLTPRGQPRSSGPYPPLRRSGGSLPQLSTDCAATLCACCATTGFPWSCRTHWPTHVFRIWVSGRRAFASLLARYRTSELACLPCACAFPPCRRFAFLRLRWAAESARHLRRRACLTDRGEGHDRHIGGTCSDLPGAARFPHRSRAVPGNRGWGTATPRPHDPKTGHCGTPSRLRATGPATGYIGVYRGISDPHPRRRTLSEKRF